MFLFESIIRIILRTFLKYGWRHKDVKQTTIGKLSLKLDFKGQRDFLVSKQKLKLSFLTFSYQLLKSQLSSFRQFFPEVFSHRTQQVVPNTWSAWCVSNFFEIGNCTGKFKGSLRMKLFSLQFGPLRIESWDWCNLRCYLELKEKNEILSNYWLIFLFISTYAQLTLTMIK